MKKLLPTLILLGFFFCAVFAQAQDAKLPLNQRQAKAAPTWITQGVMYQINPRAYTPEGTLKAAEKKLPDLAELGVSIVYLCPIFVADDDMNRDFWSPRQKASKMESPLNPYRMKDFYHVDPEYGTDADLKDYVNAAHKVGLKVMLDMVYLHCGPTAVLIDKNPNFVKRDKDGKIVTAAWKYPALNYECPELREYLHQNMEMWVRDYGVDGFRMDVADGVPLDFWEAARVRLEKLNPEIGMLAEGSRVENELKAFDLVYGWPQVGTLFNIMDRGASADSFRRAKIDFKKVRPIGGDRAIHYTENHDVCNDDYGNRSEKRWGEKGVNAMMALIFTIDGTPMLYCGQEICDKNRHSIFGSKDGCKIDWSNASSDEAKRRQALIRQLTETRKSRPELTAGEIVWLESSNSADVISFARKLGDHQTLVVINVRNKAVPVDVTLADGSKKHFDLEAYQFVIE